MLFSEKDNQGSADCKRGLRTHQPSRSNCIAPVVRAQPKLRARNCTWAQVSLTSPYTTQKPSHRTSRGSNSREMPRLGIRIEQPYLFRRLAFELFATSTQRPLAAAPAHESVSTRLSPH